MNQNNPNTHALTTRFPLEDAARLRALARAQGLTPSAFVANLIRDAVTQVVPSSADLQWVAERRAKNARRRQTQDERTKRGDYRKPGWELMPAHLKRKGA